MKCENAQEFFSEYIEASLDKPSTVALEAHLTACGSCRRGLEGLRQTWDAFKAVPAVEPPKDLAWRVMVQLQKERLERLEAQKKRTNPFVGWLQSLTPGAAFGYAMLVALLLVGAAFPLTGHMPPGITFNLQPTVQVFEQPQLHGPMVTVLKAQQDPQDGHLFYQLVITPPDQPAETRMTLKPRVMVNGQLTEMQGTVATFEAGHSQSIPVPTAVAQGPVQDVVIHVEAKGWRSYDGVQQLPSPQQPAGF
jgi:hypothetical protein